MGKRFSIVVIFEEENLVFLDVKFVNNFESFVLLVLGDFLVVFIGLFYIVLLSFVVESEVLFFEILICWFFLYDVIFKELLFIWSGIDVILGVIENKFVVDMLFRLLKSSRVSRKKVLVKSWDEVISGLCNDYNKLVKNNVLNWSVVRWRKEIFYK